MNREWRIYKTRTIVRRAGRVFECSIETMSVTRAAVRIRTYIYRPLLLLLYNSSRLAIALLTTALHLNSSISLLFALSIYFFLFSLVLLSFAFTLLFSFILYIIYFLLLSFFSPTSSCAYFESSSPSFCITHLLWVQRT